MSCRPASRSWRSGTGPNARARWWPCRRGAGRSSSGRWRAGSPTSGGCRFSGSLDLVDGGPVGEPGGNSAFRLAGVLGRLTVERRAGRARSASARTGAAGGRHRQLAVDRHRGRSGAAPGRRGRRAALRAGRRRVTCRRSAGGRRANLATLCPNDPRAWAALPDTFRPWAPLGAPVRRGARNGAHCSARADGDRPDGGLGAHAARVCHPRQGRGRPQRQVHRDAADAELSHPRNEVGVGSARASPTKGCCSAPTRTVSTSWSSSTTTRPLATPAASRTCGRPAPA